MLQLKSYLKHDYFHFMFCSLPPLGSNPVLDNPCITLLVHINTEHPPKYPKASISPCTRNPNRPRIDICLFSFCLSKTSTETVMSQNCPRNFHKVVSSFHLLDPPNPPKSSIYSSKLNHSSLISLLCLLLPILSKRPSIPQSRNPTPHVLVSFFLLLK
jgi:hypothetical protein